MKILYRQPENSFTFTNMAAPPGKPSICFSWKQPFRELAASCQATAQGGSVEASYSRIKTPEF
jgi:hypothetical protein